MIWIENARILSENERILIEDEIMSNKNVTSDKIHNKDQKKTPNFGTPAIFLTPNFRGDFCFFF